MINDCEKHNLMMLQTEIMIEDETKSELVLNT